MPPAWLLPPIPAGEMKAGATLAASHSMPIAFTCPHCGYSSKIDDSFAGRSGPCSECGQKITIPVAPPAEEPAATSRPGRTSAAANRKKILVRVAAVASVLLIVGSIVGMAAYLLMPSYFTVRELGRSKACSDNLKRIGQALRAYHEEYGSFPPAYLADENGTPMHSWRVLILPQLGEQALYEQFDLSEPWDSGMNLYLAQRMPEVYGCYSDPTSHEGQETSYMVIVGPETAFPGSEATSLDDITDDPAQTLLVVEVENSAVGWSQPLDLTTDSISWQINGPAGGSIGSLHDEPGAHVVLASGEVRHLSENVPPVTVIELSTIAGGEAVTISE